VLDKYRSRGQSRQTGGATSDSHGRRTSDGRPSSLRGQGAGLSMATRLSGPRRGGQPGLGSLPGLNLPPQKLREMVERIQDMREAGRRRWRLVIHHHHRSILDVGHDHLCPDPDVTDRALLYNKTSQAGRSRTCLYLASNAFTLGDIITSSGNEFQGFITRTAKLLLLISPVYTARATISCWSLVTGQHWRMPPFMRQCWGLLHKLAQCTRPQGWGS